MNIGLSAVNARMIICILSMIMPGILVIITGSKLPSLSEYYYTPIGPFFVGVLSLVAYLLFTMPKWIPSAILLCGVILFPNHAYPYIHNISAVLFFVTAALAILFERKFIWIGCGMLLFSPLVLFDLFITEFIMIMFISTYHLKLLLIVRKILRNRDKNRSNI